MTKLAPEWVRTSDPVIRSPASYHWTTAPAPFCATSVTKIVFLQDQFLRLVPVPKTHFFDSCPCLRPPFWFLPVPKTPLFWVVPVPKTPPFWMCRGTPPPIYYESAPPPPPRGSRCQNITFSKDCRTTRPINQGTQYSKIGHGNMCQL